MSSNHCLRSRRIHRLIQSSTSSSNVSLALTPLTTSRRQSVAITRNSPTPKNGTTRNLRHTRTGTPDVRVVLFRHLPELSGCTICLLIWLALINGVVPAASVPSFPFRSVSSINSNYQIPSYSVLTQEKPATLIISRPHS